MADENNLIIKVSLDTKGTKKGFTKVENQAGVAAQAIGANFATGFQKSFTATLAKLGGLVAVGLGVRKVTSAFLDLETAIVEVNTIAGDLGKTNDELAKEFLTLSSQFGSSAAEQANAFYQIISAGVTDATAANDLLIASNKLSIGGLASQASSIDILTTAVNAFSDSNLTGTRAADILFTTVRLGKTRVDELSNSLGQVLPTAAALGVTFEAVSGTIAQLTTRGLSTTEAVTQLNAILVAVLKNQAKAAALGPKVANAFTLQALKTKGLAGFLKDLNIALGGSEEALIKLTGRAEAARGIITLAGDDFVGLADKINQLETASGAADAAFQLINNTASQQLKRSLSTLLNIFVQLANVGASVFLPALTKITDSLTFLQANLEQITETIARFGRAAVVTALILNRQLILSKVSTAFITLRRQVVSTAIALRANFFAATQTGARGVKALSIAILNLRGAVKLLNVSIKVLKATATLGLAFILDELIGQFIELRDKGVGLADTFTIIGNRIQITFLGALRSIIKALRDNLPSALVRNLKIADEFDRAIISLSGSIGEARRANQAILAPLNATADALGRVDEKVKGLGETTLTTTPIIFDTLLNTATGFTTLILNTFDTFIDNLNKTIEFSTEQSNQLAQGFSQAFAAGISQAIQSTIKALAAGANGFEEFGKSLLTLIGDLAIFVGQFVVATGVAKLATESLPGGATIAAGLGLIAVGTLLKILGASGFAGGGGTSGGGGGGAGVFTPEPSPAIAPEEEIERTTAVTVNVEGTVLDPVAVGQQISSILDEAFNAGASTIQVNTA